MATFRESSEREEAELLAERRARKPPSRNAKPEGRLLPIKDRPARRSSNTPQPEPERKAPELPDPGSGSSTLSYRPPSTSRESSGVDSAASSYHSTATFKALAEWEETNFHNPGPDFRNSSYHPTSTWRGSSVQYMGSISPRPEMTDSNFDNNTETRWTDGVYPGY
ncbi:hypothetical protein LZ31DRAFT_258607 [Colletotrichum somersetense]|nr:hypothetical protein LZ31DRAFT_258607 [Colletotrichum somersetense]